jgi:DNA (cytosine-5)-methyltransferase 1
MKHLDLFSGIGGFALAAQWAGFETVAFCEKDPFCQKVLAKHWPDISCFPDIKSMIYRHKVDLLTGGFPCQPFSVAGKRKGVDDDRYLWPEMLRIIRKSMPTWVVGENVPGIVPVLDPIIESLESEGYTTESFLIPASLIGAPHKRERLWIVAHRNSRRCDRGSGDRQERHIQVDWQRHCQALQSEWPQFQPQSWPTFNAQEWLESSAQPNNLESQSPNRESISLPSEGSQPRATLGSRSPRPHWPAHQPPIPGVDDGLPNRVDRNKALGNAIVPQVVYPILKMIYEIENSLP